MMPRHWQGFIFLCVTVLLCLGNGTFASIDPNNLETIINYIRQYGINTHYAVAVRLEEQYCSETSQHDLRIPLPPGEMENMRKDISDWKIGIYNPEPIGNIVAARPKHLRNFIEHAEWLLLAGGQNSPVERILANKGENGCLIFFSKLSPCTDRCLNDENEKQIVEMVNPLFNRFRQDFRAFVFENVFHKDALKENEVVVRAWGKIQNSPLFRCYNDGRGCIKCFDNNNQNANNPCLGN